VVLDKSLDTVHNFEELMAVCPDVIFLNVIRDPRAQVLTVHICTLLRMACDSEPLIKERRTALVRTVPSQP
jgi:hypothetical protein